MEPTRGSIIGAIEDFDGSSDDLRAIRNVIDRRIDEIAGDIVEKEIAPALARGEKPRVLLKWSKTQTKTATVTKINPKTILCTVDGMLSYRDQFSCHRGYNKPGRRGSLCAFFNARR